MSIKDEPHYELPATELADWVERQGKDVCWTIDGDFVLGSRLGGPARGEDLATLLRRINRPLLLADKDANPSAKGQLVSSKDLERLVDTWTHFNGMPPHPKDERVFYLCWKDRDIDWMLVENFYETEAYARDLRELAEAEARERAALEPQERR